MSRDRLPDGTVAHTDEEYVEAWRAFLAPLERATGWSRYSYDPGVTMRTPDGLVQVTTAQARTLIAAFAAARREGAREGAERMREACVARCQKRRDAAVRAYVNTAGRAAIEARHRAKEADLCAIVCGAVPLPGDGAGGGACHGNVARAAATVRAAFTDAPPEPDTGPDPDYGL